MSCIVALKKDQHVYLASDSVGVQTDDWLITDREPKVFSQCHYVIGFTSSYRMGQLLQYNELPEPGRKDLHRFMCTDFVDAIRAIFSQGGFQERDKEQETGGTFMVGYGQHLYVIHNDYQVAVPKANYYAIGSGAQVALGALAILTDPALFPESRPANVVLGTAIEAARTWTAPIKGSIDMVWTT